MLKSIDGCLEPFDCLLVRLRTLKYLSWLSLIVLKKDKYLIISENVLLIQKKLVILHSVWNKYQKIKQKTQIAMSKICQITGKKAQIGNNVSHSKHRTKRSFDVNLFSKKFYYVEEQCWISLKISAAGLRLINKVGLDAALKQAVSKGYCDWKDIKVIGE